MASSDSSKTVFLAFSVNFFIAGVKTVILFFQKGEPTKKTWFYQMNPGRNLGKTNPLNDKDLAEFIELQKKMKGVFKEGTIQDEMRVVFND